MYSGKPAASLVVSDLVAENGLEKPQGCRRLNEAGLQAVDLTADRIADLVDELLDKRWNRRAGEFIEMQTETAAEPEETIQATCSCGSGIPVQESSGRRADSHAGGPAAHLCQTARGWQKHQSTALSAGAAGNGQNLQPHPGWR